MKFLIGHKAFVSLCTTLPYIIFPQPVCDPAISLPLWALYSKTHELGKLKIEKWRNVNRPSCIIFTKYQQFIQSIIVFCPRAGISLQTQHSPPYPLLSLPFRIFIQSIYNNGVYLLISSSASNFLPISHTL